MLPSCCSEHDLDRRDEHPPSRHAFDLQTVSGTAERFAIDVLLLKLANRLVEWPDDEQPRPVAREEMDRACHQRAVDASSARS